MKEISTGPSVLGERDGQKHWKVWGLKGRILVEISDMGLCRAGSGKWSQADKSSLAQPFGSGTWVQTWKASRLLSRLQFIAGRTLGKCLPGVRSGGHPWGRAQGQWSTVRSVSSNASVHCLGAFLTDPGSSSQKPALSIFLPPAGWSFTATGPVGACLWPLNTQLLSRTCPLLFAWTNFLPLPTSYLTLLLLFISAIADVKC